MKSGAKKRRATGRRTGSTIAASAAPSSSGAGPQRPWEDLPDGILYSVLCRLPSIPSLVACSAVCRSWRALAVTDASPPPLLLRPLMTPRRRYRRAPQGTRWRLLDPANPAASYPCVASPESLSIPFVSYSRGSLILHHLGRILVVDVFTGNEVRPPDLPCKPDIFSALLTVPLRSPHSTLLIWGSYTLFQWQVGSGTWTAHHLRTQAPFIKHMVAVKGEVFALDGLERLLAINLADNVRFRQVEMSPTSIKPAMYTHGSWLVERGDELLMVRFAKTLTMGSYDVQVFRLDSSEQAAWVNVESLGDWALFICPHQHNPGLACKNPGRWGGRSNCVYYARRGNSAWTVLPLGMTIDTTDPGCFLFSDEPSGAWILPVWVYPSKFA